MTAFHLLALAGLGAGAGIIGALLGLGGGLLITPLLNLLFGIPIEVAIATSLVAVIGTSSATASVYVEQKLSDIRLGMVLELATTMGAVSGAVVAGLLSRRMLTILFSLFLAYAGTSMLRRAGSRELASEDPEEYRVKRVPLGLFLSYLAGGISGLLGVGGGPIKVPLMYLLMGIPLKVATATSNFMIGVTAAASAFVYYQRGHILAYPTAPVVVGVFAGSLVGSHVSRRVPTRWILWLFVSVMFYLAVTMAVKAIRMGTS